MVNKLDLFNDYFDMLPNIPYWSFAYFGILQLKLQTKSIWNFKTFIWWHAL